MKEGGKTVRRRKSRESVVLIADAISESINSLFLSLSLTAHHQRGLDASHCSCRRNGASCRGPLVVIVVEEKEMRGVSAKASFPI